MNPAIQAYNNRQTPADREICDLLATAIDSQLTESTGKIWHAQPVWFLDGNPIVGFTKQKKGIRLMFWSGADFGEESLPVLGAKFRDASTFYSSPSEVELTELKRWLGKARNIQWDYKNIVKRKGILERLK